MKRSPYVWAALAAWSLLPFAAQAAPNPYMGDPVAQAVAPNGALMNAGLAATRAASKAPQVVNLRPGVWVLRDFSIVNCTIVETPEGLVVFDAGTSVGQGELFLSEIRKLSAKPVIAMIYSHNHYTRGASAMVPGGMATEVPVIGHPKLEANFAARSLTTQPVTMRRVNMQFGAYLPESGEDAGISPPSPKGLAGEKLANGHVRVNREVRDGESLTLGGMEFQFFHGQGDTDDTLTVWIPQLSTVLTNVTSQTYFALYTLRGEPYRDPQAVIDSYDTLRRLRPQYYAPTHGDPIAGAALIERRMTAHRDAYSFTFNQAIRGINAGWGPDELVERIRLPDHLGAEPTLYEGYSEFTFALRGIYRGLIGWYGEDAADMHPPTPRRLGVAIVEGFGGSEAVLARARAALARREYALAAKLADYAVDAEPTNGAARTVKAAALRRMAQVAWGSQSYNFLLTEARHLEGKIDMYRPVGGSFSAVTFESVAGMPSRALVAVLESRIDPQRSAGVEKTMRLGFTDAPDRFAIEVRNGVAEVRDAAGADGPELSMDRRTWFELIGRQRPLSVAVAQGRVKLTGAAAEEAEAFLAMFDPL